MRKEENPESYAKLASDYFYLQKVSIYFQMSFQTGIRIERQLYYNASVQINLTFVNRAHVRFNKALSHPFLILSHTDTLFLPPSRYSPSEKISISPCTRAALEMCVLWNRTHTDAYIPVMKRKTNRAGKM